jgi:predicted metalloendopeptidase
MAIAGALLLSGCSLIADPDRSKIDDDLYNVPDSGMDASAPKAIRAAMGDWGYDVAGMDPNVKPGDDFNRYANGKWLQNNVIPPDRTGWNSFSVLSVKVEQQINDIIEALPADAPAGSPSQKVHDFYRAYLDTQAIEGKGPSPLAPGLARIGSAASHEDVARLLASIELGLPTPIEFGVGIDQKNPDRYIVSITQGGLSLPDRDYYLESDPATAAIRTEYVAHIARTLTLIGEPDAQAKAEGILDLETQIARIHWPAEKRRERELTYNLRTRAQLDELSASFPWSAFFDEAKIGSEREFIVREVDAVGQLGDLVRAIPIERWVSYMKYNYVVAHATVLPKAFDDERFGFYGTTLYGQTQLRERWRRATSVVNSTIGEIVGQLYVAKHFPPEHKAQVLKIVENLRTAFVERLRKLEWMSPETKKRAMDKLSTFYPKIGFPDKWKDYSALEVRAGDAFGNAVRARVWGWADDIGRLGKPTDRSEWLTTPQTVNAYYYSTFNDITFPAAILQPPFFDPNADPAVNYGGIGAVIGHEMGHGFDDQGAKSDERGVLSNWWQPADEASFKVLVDKLVKQYDQYEALPGLKVNGRLTVGENLGDLGGLTLAYDAYKISQGGWEPDEFDGFNDEQRFFLSWAQIWRELIREQALRSQVLSDPHSPSALRINGIVRNLDVWYDAFDVKPGDALWLDPAARVKIW